MQEEQYGSKMPRVANVLAIGGSAALSLIVVLLLVANTFSGIVSGIWLAIIGEWRLIGLGICMTLLMPTAFSIVMLPQFGLAVPLVLAAERGNKLLTGVLGLVASLYGNIVVGLWVFLVFSLFAAPSGDGTHLPFLLWGYATAMAPLAYMTSKEPPDSTGTALGLLLAELSYLTLIILHYSVGSLKVSVLGVASLVLFLSLGTALLGVALAQSTRTSAYGGESVHWTKDEPYGLWPDDRDDSQDHGELRERDADVPF